MVSTDNGKAKTRQAIETISVAAAPQIDSATGEAAIKLRMLPVD